MLEPHVEKLLKQRYYKPGEDWEALVNRVVSYVCKDDPDLAPIARELILRRVFLPNSPALVNAGGHNNGLFACFTVGPEEDSLEAHLEALADIAAVARAAGGCGFSGTTIRPKGSPVAGSAHGYAYGPNAYARNVSNYLSMMTQGGFRGMALMYDLGSEHPDLDEFIDLKQGDEAHMTNFNQSIMATDDWMQQAMLYPQSKAHAQLKRVAANAWNNGEPGLLFADRINDNTPYKTCGCRIYTTNPCCARGTLVNTITGMRPVETIKVGDLVSTVIGFEKVTSIEKHDAVQTYRVRLSDGGEQFVTKDHIYHVYRKGDSKAKAYNTYRLSELVDGDYIQVSQVQVKANGNYSDYLKGNSAGVRVKEGGTLDLGSTDLTSSFIEGFLGAFDGENDDEKMWKAGNRKAAQLIRSMLLYQGMHGHILDNNTVRVNNTWEARILDITPHDIVDVYDLYCEESDTWITDGYVQRGCGEQPLPPYGSCNLGSVNLAHPYLYTENGELDLSALELVIRVMTRFLDNVGSVNAFPNSKFSTWYEKHRPIGIGPMGVADMFIKLGIRYGSEESLALLDKVMGAMYRTALQESEKLGQERGIPEHCKAVNRRNITVTTVAPTGSISFIADCSSGIEPVFGSEFTRTDERGEVYHFSHPHADKPYFVSILNDDESKTPTWQEHIAIQAVAQKHVDSGVSKTVNLPNSATVDDVWGAYLLAYNSGCKGITVYRDGSRTKQVLAAKEDIQPTRLAPKRPPELPCSIHPIKYYGDWLVVVGEYKGEPFEVFAFKHPPIQEERGTLVKEGSGIYTLRAGALVVKDITKDCGTDEEPVARLISTALRHGIPARFIVEQLGKTNTAVSSFTKVISRVLSSILPEDTQLKGGNCPTCSEKLVMVEGCKKCPSCGYSAC